MISQQRGLEYKNNPQEDMVKLLQYEASLQCKDSDQAIWQTGKAWYGTLNDWKQLAEPRKYLGNGCDYVTDRARIFFERFVSCNGRYVTPTPHVQPKELNQIELQFQDLRPWSFVIPRLPRLWKPWAMPGFRPTRSVQPLMLMQSE